MLAKGASRHWIVPVLDVVVEPSELVKREQEAVDACLKLEKEKKLKHCSKCRKVKEFSIYKFDKSGQIRLYGQNGQIGRNEKCQINWTKLEEIENREKMDKVANMFEENANESRSGLNKL